jgi:hypothetical protein
VLLHKHSSAVAARWCWASRHHPRYQPEEQTQHTQPTKAQSQTTCCPPLNAQQAAAAAASRQQQAAAAQVAPQTASEAQTNSTKLLLQQWV